ncbi:hypothetical protein [Sabulicella rubraurantiaca]|uniref:hypothetical protein n=1 Tax=Sabulicella rubraurantiaca TaxID=2811429 RepID=UPI001A9789FF|nr:hypothetical protein [Sabulicella rubraurantiaca]
MAGLADLLGAASARAMATHLTAPLRAGAAQRIISVNEVGALAVGFPTRRPLLLLAVRRDLQARPLEVRAEQADGAVLPPLSFAEWSEAGTALPLFNPGVEAGGPFTLTISATLGGTPLPSAELGEWLEGLLSEGELGRLIAVLGAEKARTRREARRLLAMRRLEQAADDALDRLGADLGVPRLDAVPEWDAARREITARPEPENDPAFRRRLGIYRPFIAPTPAAALSLLRQGIPEVRLAEPGNPLAVAVSLVAIGPAAPRDEMLARLRADWLVHPRADAESDAVHAPRFLPAPRRAAVEALRARLRGGFDFPPGAALSPGLAVAMDRAARILAALGHAGRLAVQQAQDPAGGNRFETGLGLSVTPVAVGEADALRDLLLAPREAGDDREAEALIAEARAEPPPEGDVTLDWLWRAAGIRTRHRLSTGALFLSDMPMRGLTITGPSVVPLGTTASFHAAFEAEGDPTLNEALGRALAEATARQPASGAPGFTVLDPDAAAARRAASVDVPAGSTVANLLAAAGLPAPGAAAATTKALDILPTELHRAIVLDAALSAQIRAGAVAAIAPLQSLVQLLRESGVTSLLPLATPTEILLVAGVTPLPIAGVNLGERRATGLRWAVVPLSGTATLAQQGPHAVLTPGEPGLIALVALGHIRDGRPDPYEIRCELPEGRLLDLAEYEWLMNALERCFALGVEINTWRLRQAHVDLDGDGAADPLPPSLARHYRRFRMPRLRGLDEPEKGI